VREGGSYSQETRKIILSLERIRKVAPNGKEVLKDVSLGMYLGAKIGVLGANGAGKSSLMRILAGVDDKFDGKVVRAPGIRWVFWGRGGKGGEGGGRGEPGCVCFGGG
jgi:ABC-type polysaccharide/polyol phosphate transport system ATPase subunit